MSVIQIKGPLPGPKSAALIERRKKAVASGVSLAHPLFLQSADNATVTDVDGNTFIDFAGGIGCLNVGHARKEVVEAAQKAAARLTHACFQVTGYEEYVAVCESLVRLAPGSFDKRAVLFSTGAEAVENAVKIARKATGRGGVLCFEHAFHGRTLLGMSLTGKASPYKNGFGPMAAEIYRLPFPYAYRDESANGPWEGRIDQMLLPHVHPSSLSCVILEPIQGEGGFIVPPKAFMAELRAFCDRNGIALIFDEVQSGMGRTGAMFAGAGFGVVPDLTTTAKSIAGGLPLSGVVGRADMIEKTHVGGLGGTYAGNPVACAAAVAAIGVLEAEIASGRAQQMAEKLRGRLQRIAEKSPLVGEIRGVGPMMAVELVTDKSKKTPAADQTKAIIAAARDKGVLLLSAGTWGNVLRFLMPLTIEPAVLDEGMDVVEAAFASAAP